jgi:colanic acid biosynthesis glycosyl transferase WcaI
VRRDMRTESSALSSSRGDTRAGAAARFPATARRTGPILFVSLFFPPDKTGIAPYSGRFVDHLKARGHDVDVITGVPHYPEWRIADDYRHRLRTIEVDGQVRVQRLRHFVPRRPGASGRALYEASFFMHAMARPLRRKPRLVLAVSPGLGGAGYAAGLARRAGVPFGLYVQDLVGKAARQSGQCSAGGVSSMTVWLESAVLRQADRVAIVAESFRPTVVAAGVPEDHIHLVPNWTHIGCAQQDLATTRHMLGWPADATIVLHSGNMGAKQALENVVQTAKLVATDAPELLFVLMGNGNQRSYLERIGAGLPNLRFVDPVSDSLYADALAAADVLLVNERATVIDMSLPSKLTSYFSVGRPVVAAVPSSGSTANEVRKSGGGVVVPAEDPIALLTAINRIRLSPTLVNALSASGWSYARRQLAADAAESRLDQFLDLLLRLSG